MTLVPSFVALWTIGVSSMTNVFGLVVMKNEEHRYLREFIEHHQYVFHDIFVFNDNSTDRSAEICSINGLKVFDSLGPSFLEHEGQFRFNAWQAFEATMKPSTDDWVFVIDADEFVVGNVANTRDALTATIELAEYFDYSVVRMKKNEVWQVDGNRCYVRKDGLWDKIKVNHLFKYEPNGRWNMKAMGCGSAPTYTRVQPFNASNVSVLHFGYAREQDRQEKYERYSSMSQHGHNPNHILSIVRRPKLAPYEGHVPDWVQDA